MELLSRHPSSKSVMNSGSSSKNTSKTKLALEFLRQDKARYGTEGQPVPIPTSRVEQQRKHLVNKRYSAIMKAWKGTNNNNASGEGVGVKQRTGSGIIADKASIQEKAATALRKKSIAINFLPGFRYHRDGSERKSNEIRTRRYLRIKAGLDILSIVGDGEDTKRDVESDEDDHGDKDHEEQQNASKVAEQEDQGDKSRQMGRVTRVVQGIQQLFGEVNPDAPSRKESKDSRSSQLSGSSRSRQGNKGSDSRKGSTETRSRQGSKDSRSNQSSQSNRGTRNSQVSRYSQGSEGSGPRPLSLNGSGPYSEYYGFKQGMQCFDVLKHTSFIKTSQTSFTSLRGNERLERNMDARLPDFIIGQLTATASCKLAKMMEEDSMRHETPSKLRKEQQKQLDWHKEQERLRAAKTEEDIKVYMEKARRLSQTSFTSESELTSSQTSIF